jgi:hypothetical protein
MNLVSFKDNSKVSFFFSGNTRFFFSLLSALLFLIIQMYLNTGTLSGYAVTLHNPHVIEGGYIVNYDYTHYQCNYNFIIGEPTETWNAGWVLRRELFYFLAFPFLKLFGFYIGGTLAAFTITLIAFYSLIKFTYETFGVLQAYVAISLLTSYSGIMYWIGSPFAQIMIVPCCCWLYMILWKMSKTTDFYKHLRYLSVISILFTAYDLFIFFYPALLLFYLNQRAWKKMIVSIPIMIIPQALIMILLRLGGAEEIKSDNSGLYLTIIKSYFNILDFKEWFTLLLEVPKILLNNFLDANFWFLPILFLVIVVWGITKKIWLNRIETNVLISALAVFLFNNMAPHYNVASQMRGEWIARIYQPIFIVLIMYIVRFSGEIFKSKKTQRTVFIMLLSSCCFGGFILNFGVSLKSNFSQWAWHRFYQHSEPDSMQKNLTKFGVRPIGFSDHSIKKTIP